MCGLVSYKLCYLTFILYNLVIEAVLRLEIDAELNLGYLEKLLYKVLKMALQSITREKGLVIRCLNHNSDIVTAIIRIKKLKGRLKSLPSICL